MAKKESYFTEEDVRLLEKTLNIREKMVDHLLTKGFPEKSRDVLALSTLLESLDKTILTKSKLAIDDKKNENDAEFNKTIALSILKEVHRNRNDIQASKVMEAVLPDAKTHEVKDTELIQGVMNISYDEFVNK
jgi:hypothetical protein